MNSDAVKLYFDTRPVEAFDDLVSGFDSGGFASPFRSTVPLIALIKDAPDVFARILASCGLYGPTKYAWSTR